MGFKKLYHFSKEKENKKSKRNVILKKVYYFSERSRLARYASPNTAMIHFSSRQKPQKLQSMLICKNHKYDKKQ